MDVIKREEALLMDVIKREEAMDVIKREESGKGTFRIISPGQGGFRSSS